MRKIILTLMASLFSCSAASAFWPEATDSSLEIGVGYRRDNIQWRTSSDLNASSSGSGSDSSSYNYGQQETATGLPPVKLHSDLKWKKLDIVQIEGRGKYITCDNIYLRACADYGWITSGKNRDTDYIVLGGGSGSDSGSGNEIARSTSRARGHVYDAKIAIGYQFKMCDDNFSIAPVFGYSWHGQHLRDRHLKQHLYLADGSVTISETAPVGGTSTSSSSGSSYDYSYDDYSYSDYSYSDFSSYSNSDSYSGGNRINSKYHTRWNGFFVGFDADYRFLCDYTFCLAYEFHFAEYHAKARWNYNQNLMDGFHQRAKNAYGNVLDIGLKWDICECWTVGIKGQFQWWEAKHGRDRALTARNKLGNVKQDCYVSIPLRHVRWHSESVSVDVGMMF